MDKDLKEAIDREQLRLAMQQVPTMQGASVVVALVLSVAARDFVSRGNILFFVLSISAVAASRVILYKRYLKACTKPFVARDWKSAYILLALISGIVWGGSAFLILPAGNAWLLALFVLVMASLSASTTVSHSSIKWAPAAFMAPAMLLYAIHCILETGEQVTILAFLIVLYLLVMLQYSIKHHGTITTSIALRFEKLKLLEESRQGEERMRVILDSTDDGILAVDGSGKAIFSNRRFSELWRIPLSLADTGDDDAMLEFVREQLVDPDAFLRKVKKLYATADIDNDIILFKDGRIFERYSMPMMNNGSVIGRLWSFRDITGRKGAEEELRLSRQLLALHVQQTPLAVVRFDLEGRVREWNPAATRVFGYSPEEAIGQHWTFVVPESVWGQLEGVWEGLVSRRGGSRSTNENRTKDGRRINCEWFNTTLVDPEGRAVGIASLVMDVTERERAEREKEKLHAQLQQAIKMEAVGRLAGGVAHDFNNLLMVITGYSELLLQKIGKESPMHREVEEIKRAGERAASLTQQLLAFSRKQIIEPKVLHLDSLVAEMHKMLPRLIGEDIALQAITGKSLGSVKVDPGQFQQILMNLVVNARDAMPDGGKIVIETANVDLDEGYCALHPYVKPGRFVMLSVSDTGHGMSEEVKKHIFEPFFTTKEKGSGTGLGLATTYGAVKQAGGSIEVYSEVGTGTTFKIYLPRVEEEATKPVKDDRPRDLPGGAETVLLVEDEDSVRDLCVQILERLGYKVLQGSNGAEAISVAKKYSDRIDLLLTDVVMPGMNGSELATQLVLHHPEMKVLFMSGYTDDAIARHGILDEGVLFIGKPYSPSVLAKKIREVLDKVG